MVENIGASGIHFLQSPYTPMNFDKSFAPSNPNTRMIFAIIAGRAITVIAHLGVLGVDK